MTLSDKALTKDDWIAAAMELLRTQGIGDMYRIYLDCQRDGLDYNLAYITDDFDMKPKEDFDPVYMGALFDLGYRMAEKGYPWDKAPPGFQ